MRQILWGCKTISFFELSALAVQTCRRMFTLKMNSTDQQSRNVIYDRNALRVLVLTARQGSAVAKQLRIFAPHPVADSTNSLYCGCPISGSWHTQLRAPSRKMAAAEAMRAKHPISPTLKQFDFSSKRGEGQ
jgi:hypothetical protein